MVASLHEQLAESLTAGRIASAVIVFLAGSLVVDFAWKPRLPTSIPRVGHGSGFVATLKDMLGYVMHYNDWVREGYVKYTKKDQAFIVPSAASRPPDVVIPRSQTMWMLELPDKVLSTHEAHNDVLFSEYNFLGKRFSDDVWHTRVIHKSLARHLNALIPGVQEEVHPTIDAVFGTDTKNWKKINLWDAWLNIVPRVTNRMLVNAPTCRNKEFLDCMVSFTDDVVRNSFLLNLAPKITHPIVGRLATIPNWWHWRKATKHVIPVIRQRLHDMARKEAKDPEYDDWVEPEDFISWTIRMAKAEGNSFELDPYVISKRLLPIEFAAIHTTVLTGHNVILDLLGTDPSKGCIEALREETARVLAEEEVPGQWSKSGLSRLFRVDSAIRESMRVSNFATTLVERKVIAPEGVTNKKDGYHLPYGSFVTLNLQGIHHDDDNYPDADSYDAFRYSRQREEFEKRADDERDPDEALRLKKLGMVTTSDMHLAFGHGRHACPGRFFVAHELKMVISYLLLNYDLKPLAERPKPQWMGATIIPPLQACVEIRRREGTV